MTVYFAQVGDVDGAVKIGCVNGNLTYRLNLLDKQAGLPARYVALTSGHRFVERWFRRRHWADRLDGEWFNPSRALRCDIAALAAGERVDGQPLEPAANEMPPHLLRHYRLTHFRFCQRVMAAALGLSLSAYRGGECYGAPLLWAIDLAELARREAVDLALPRIMAESEQAAARVAA